jgi:hypothetical protein
MGEATRPHLVLLRGGLVDGEAEPDPFRRVELRVIDGGPDGDVQVAIEQTIQSARRIRLEIEARIARAFEERP